VELINTAAKKLIDVTNLKNIKTLQRFSKPLVDSLLALKSGERALVGVDINGNKMQLAVFATEFRMRDKKFTLASIQNIQSELERERMVKELEIAHQVQMSLLPKGSPQIAGFDIAGICIPAEEVGGDYYDFIDLGDSKLGIAVGDVSGKGVPAAIYMTLTKGIIQSQAEERLSPKDVLTKINALMYQSIERKAFVSMIYSIIDVANRRLVCSRAGHNPAIYFRAGEKDCVLIEPSGIGLGLESGDVFQNVIREQEINLQTGDLLIFHTDGFTEAMNRHYHEYGEAHLINVIRENINKTSKEIIEAVSRDVKTFRQTHPQHDDMTMVSVKVN
jgi:sigma-B regulation protein RsbU (phosphoserine phosphatase)